MIIEKEEAKRIVWEDHEDWDEVTSEVIDNTRWSVLKEGVFKHLPTGKFYQVNWSEGATEMQDEAPFDYDDEVTFDEVELKEVTVEKWVLV